MSRTYNIFSTIFIINIFAFIFIWTIRAFTLPLTYEYMLEVTIGYAAIGFLYIVGTSILDSIAVKEKTQPGTVLVDLFKPLYISKLTKQELANAVSVSVQTIEAIEVGDYEPSLLLALKIARELETPFEEIFTLRGVSDE